MNNVSEMENVASHGVERLIERLRDEGVAKGQAEADALIAEAERRAKEIIAKAESDAEAFRRQAQTDAENFRKAGEAALQLAARDAILKLRDNLIRHFGEEVKSLVGKAMNTDEVMRTLIEEAAGRALRQAGVEQARTVTVLLPGHIKDLAQLRKNPEELKEGTLSHFVLSVGADLLRKGITLKTSDSVHGGIVVRLEDRDITVDLTDGAVASVLLEHMAPRYRALLEGMIR
ncbi:MAG: V-type ATP synthase subunit E family protein [Pseudomonadota bacterium]